jgi:hypothetical protein
MPAPAWVSYVGAVTGVIATIVAIVSAIVSDRRVSKIKALDLRLDVRKLEADVDDALSSLPKLIEDAKQSRIAIKSAAGTLRTGWMEQWLRDANADGAAVVGLHSEFKAAIPDHRSLSESDLERRSVEIHQLKTKVNGYVEKYRASRAEDDRERELHRAGQRALPRR